jgi:hypothetical protein
MRGQIDNIRFYEYHGFLYWTPPSLYSISLYLKWPSARFPTSSDNDMTEPTHIIDTERDAILLTGIMGEFVIIGRRPVSRARDMFLQ